MSRLGKKLTTFEIEGQNIVVNKLQYKVDPKRNRIFSVFSVVLLNGRKNSNLFTLPDLDNIKQVMSVSLTLHLRLYKLTHNISFFLSKLFTWLL